MKILKDKVAVVTGAAGGIGRALVQVLAAEGMKVVMAGINAERLERAAEEFREKGADVTPIVTDVSRAEQVTALAEKTMEQYGAVHLLCNNAGVSYNSRSSWETPLAGWEWVLGVNLMGVVHGIHAFLPLMLEQADEAHIVNTASTSGLIMNGYAIPYGVSKHAVVALSESLHLELESRNANVGVSVLCPGRLLQRSWTPPTGTCLRQYRRLTCQMKSLSWKKPTGVILNKASARKRWQPRRFPP